MLLPTKMSRVTIYEQAGLLLFEFLQQRERTVKWLEKNLGSKKSYSALSMKKCLSYVAKKHKNPKVPKTPTPHWTPHLNFYPTSTAD